MVSCAATALVLLLAAASAASAARPVQQQSPADVGVTFKPVSLGDGSQRLLTRGYFKAQGGALNALSRPTLLSLKRSSRFRGSVESFAAHLDKEKDLGVDAINKALLYQCKGMTANVSASDFKTAGAVAAADATVTVAQAFSLSSRPSASRKILLDFDGHTTTGTWWNDFVVRQNIVTPPYDKDGSPTTWSADELSDIVAIWRAVSEDFAMFDVDVTTIDPGNAALTGTGVRVAIGGAWTDWYPTAAGGVAYVSKFGVANLPCFIFPKNLGPNYAKYIWEATSHEVGHTLGLSHDGVTGGTAYYSGQGNWAPIMGTGYNKAVTQFNKGEYAGSNNKEDDLAVMGGFLPLLATSAGSSQATAAPLATVDAATGTATANVQGVVASAAGAWYSLKAAAGTVTLSAAVVAPWSGATNRANLDIQLVVYDAAGTALATLNPAGSDAASLGVPATPVTLPASGTYVVAVTGAGADDAASTGYSSYASRGQFELTAVYAPCTTCSDAPPQASPSPAPVPSPSPSPAPVPSPSPSPAPVPSPSPAPVPSPSPLPSPPPAQPQAMRVTSIIMTKVPQGQNRFFCSVTIYVRDAAGNPVSGVRVNGAFSAQPVLTSFASATSSLLTAVNTGTVAFRSANSVPRSPVYTCVFSIGNVSLAGYFFDAANSVLTRTAVMA